MNKTPKSVARFRKKPVAIEAIQYTGDPASAYEISEWAHAGFPPEAGAIILNNVTHLSVRTLEGDMIAMPGDWIIKGIKGEFYPCKPDIFAATYEPADSAPAMPEDEVMEMALCESRRLVLRIGQAYRFVPMDGCATCETMKKEHDDAYGDARRRIEGE